MKFTTLLAPLLAATLATALPAAEHAADAKTTAAPVQVAGFTYVKTVGQISEYTLDHNGLDVLLMTDHSAPVVTFMVTYHVGSRNEGLGVTGATHLLEHLMFKGSPKFNDAKGDSIKQYLERVGARYNATTAQDRTNYFATLGSDHLAGYMAIEADRMRHLWLHESDREKEMTVVRNEYERGENSPFQALMKAVYAAAFVAHPYHHPVIGWRSDIENIPIGRLRQFYDTFYWPNNATVTIIGDFDPAHALGLVKKYYGGYTRSPQPIPPMYTVEPAQNGPRRVIVKRAGQLGVVAIAHKIPAATNPDIAAIAVLDSILGEGTNSRLNRALTDHNLATGVYVWPSLNHDPSLNFIFIPLAPEVAPATAEQAALDVINKIQQHGVTDAEVRAASAQLLADFAYQRDGSYAIADNLNDAIAVGDWTLYYRKEDAVRHVTAADVQRVAKEYFNADQSTTGWFEPIAPTAH